MPEDVGLEYTNDNIEEHMFENTESDDENIFQDLEGKLFQSKNILLMTLDFHA